MKFKALSIFATTLVLSLATALSALAESGTLSASSGSRVNVRQSPSTSAPIRHYGIGGDRVNILQRTNAPDGYLWYFVEFPNSGARGWVRGDLVRVDGGSSGGNSSTQRINFAPGTSGATVGGRVQGAQSRNYLLGARAGQRVTTRITGTSPFVQLRVFAPNGANLYTGSGNWSGRLPSSGDYRLQIRIVPEEQGSGESGEYSLSVVVQ